MCVNCGVHYTLGTHISRRSYLASVRITAFARKTRSPGFCQRGCAKAIVELGDSYGSKIKPFAPSRLAWVIMRPMNSASLLACPPLVMRAMTWCSGTLSPGWKIRHSLLSARGVRSNIATRTGPSLCVCGHVRNFGVCGSLVVCQGGLSQPTMSKVISAMDEAAFIGQQWDVRFYVSSIAARLKSTLWFHKFDC